MKQHAFAAAADAHDVPPGAYQLVVGFYDLQTGQRFGPEYDIATVDVSDER